MLDCMSNGRLISGFARGIPREYQVHDVRSATIPRALRRGVRHHHPGVDRRGVLVRGVILVVQGRGDLAAALAAAASADLDADHRQQGIDRIRRRARFADHPWPRPLARLARRHHPPLRALPRRAGHHITPDHLSLGISAYVADSKAEAVREIGPHHLYFNRTLFSHGNFTETSRQRETGYSSAASTDYVRPENLRAAQFAREDFRNMTMDDVERQAEEMPWGTAEEVPDGSSPPPTAPAPTMCRSASIAGCCRTRCSSSRSAASPATCCRCCKPIAWPASHWPKRSPPDRVGQRRICRCQAISRTRETGSSVRARALAPSGHVKMPEQSGRCHAEPVYFLLHIPKTAGQTIQQHFAQHCAPGVFWQSSRKLRPGRRERPDALPDRDRARVVAGHHISCSLVDLFKGREIRRILLLRDPLQLQISLYNWQMIDNIAKGLGTYSFDIHLRALHRNFMSTFHCRAGWGSRNGRCW